MRSLFAFVKKEALDQLRSFKLMILGLIFLGIGIMNPAVAKLTPVLLDLMSETLEQAGLVIPIESVNALDSWVQFFKNIPLGLIAFVLLESNIFTKEYRSGTVILSLTKGLERFKVVVAKAVTLLVLWTACYWLCFGVTYAANEYLWENSVAQSLALSAVCWWLFGVFTLSIIVLFSTVVSSNGGVLLYTGGIVFTFYILSIIPKVNEYFPTYLMSGTSLVYGAEEASAYVASIIITAVASVACLVLSVPIFNKKQL